MAQKFKYNGVELEESFGLNLYEMDLRQYDPAIARWTGIDPVTHHSMSTYTAFDNNPVYWADPSEADSWTYVSNGIYRNNQTGEETNDWQRAINETQSHISSDQSKSPTDWFVNNKTGEVHHDKKKKKGDEKQLGDDWAHLAGEDEIEDEIDAISGASNSESTGITYSLEQAIELLSNNGWSLAPKTVFRDITVIQLITIPNSKIDVSITQTNIIEIWLDLTYVKSTAVPFNENLKVFQDISHPQGYQQYQKMNRTYSNSLWQRFFNYGKSMHRKGSADSAGSSITTYIGWDNYEGSLTKFKNK